MVPALAADTHTRDGGHGALGLWELKLYHHNHQGATILYYIAYI